LPGLWVENVIRIHRKETSFAGEKTLFPSVTVPKSRRTSNESGRIADRSKSAAHNLCDGSPASQPKLFDAELCINIIIDAFRSRSDFERKIRACYGLGPLILERRRLQLLKDRMAFKQAGIGAISQMITISDVFSCVIGGGDTASPGAERLPNSAPVGS
jgi:hypothetical protein